MPVDALFTAVVETSINKLLSESQPAQQQLAKMKGQILQVEISDLKKSLFFVFSQQVDVLAQFEAEPDCHLTLTLDSLPQLRTQTNLTQLIKQGKLDLQGEHKLAQEFAQLLELSKPDVEEWLSHYTGDVLAHLSIQGAKNARIWLQSAVARQQDQVAQLVTEEWQLAPHPLAIAHFCDQVEELALKTGQVEARLNALMERL